MITAIKTKMMAVTWKLSFLLCVTAGLICTGFPGGVAEIRAPEI